MLKRLFDKIEFMLLVLFLGPDGRRRLRDAMLARLRA